MKTSKMLHALTICFVMLFATALYADDTVRSFTQPTLDGKTVRSETLKGMPLVINFSAPE